MEPFEEFMSKYAEQDDHRALKAMGVMGGAAVAGGLAYAAMRKFSPSGAPALRALQEKTKNMRVAVGTQSPEMLANRHGKMLYGADIVPATQSEAATRKIPFRDSMANTVLENNSDSVPEISGALHIDAGPIRELFDDKQKYINHMAKVRVGGQSVVPRSENLKDALARHKGDWSKLRQEYPTHVIKPSVDSGGDTMKDFVSDHTPESASKIKDIKSRARAGGHVIQERLPIDKEYRVHLLNNVPYAVSKRFQKLPGPLEKIRLAVDGNAEGSSIIPVFGKERKAVMDFAGEASKNLGGKAVGNTLNFHQGMDVARLQDGTHRIIESNTGYLGTMGNPVHVRQYHHELTGRWDKGVSSGAAAIAAVGGAGVTAGVEHAVEKSDSLKSASITPYQSYMYFMKKAQEDPPLDDITSQLPTEASESTGAKFMDRTGKPLYRAAAYLGNNSGATLKRVGHNLLFGAMSNPRGNGPVSLTGSSVGGVIDGMLFKPVVDAGIGIAAKGMHLMSNSKYE